MIEYKPSQKQGRFHELTDMVEVVFGGAKGGGKALRLSTPIPTPRGWTTIGELEPGSKVFGEYGQIETVLAKSEVMHDRPCYKLVFDDGTEIVADADHLWKTFTAQELRQLEKRNDEYRAKRRAKRKKRGTGKRPDLAARNSKLQTETKEPPTGGIRTTQEVFDTLTVRKDNLKNHVVMNAKALELPEKELPVDPYVFGLWLGDGSKSCSRITTNDGEVLAFIEEAGYSWKKLQAKCAFAITGLITEIRKTGTYKNKHIPMEYLRSSCEQRLALLQGLMDSDGYARPHGGAEFTNTSRELAEGVRELIVSLGWKATIKTGDATLNGRVISDKYRIVFTPDKHVFRLPRKKEAQVLARNKRSIRRHIVDVVPVESEPVQCIQVTNSMFLCSESMVPTHNSTALIMDAWGYAATFPGAEVYLFRETYDDLEANRIAEFKRRVPPEAQAKPYNETKHEAFIKSRGGGVSVIKFRYCRNLQDADGYQGRSIDYIGIDELTKHTKKAVQILLSCLRSAKGFPPRFRGTCNPGGIGHAWVKNRYITATDYGESTAICPETGNSIAFVPATVYDNEVLMKNDPAYIRRLENLPEAQKKAFLYGDWDSFEGASFEKFSNRLHVVEPFEIPSHWKRWMAADNGYTDPFAWYWFAVDEKGTVYIYDEFTREYDDPKLTYSQQAEEVASRMMIQVWDEEEQKHIEKLQPIQQCVLGHDAFAKSHETGKTLVDYYREGGLTLPFTKAVTDRRLRKATFVEYLEPRETGETDENGEPIVTATLKIFSSCRKLVETLPLQVNDEKDTEKVALTDYDHWYDGAGYGLIAHHQTRSKPLPEPETPIQKHKAKLARMGRQFQKRIS